MSLLVPFDEDANPMQKQRNWCSLWSVIVLLYSHKHIK